MKFRSRFPLALSVIFLSLTRANQHKESAEASSAHAAETDAEKASRAALVLLHRLIQLAGRRAANLDLKSLLQIAALPAAEDVFPVELGGFVIRTIMRFDR